MGLNSYYSNQDFTITLTKGYGVTMKPLFFVSYGYEVSRLQDTGR